MSSIFSKLKNSPIARAAMATATPSSKAIQHGIIVYLQQNPAQPVKANKLRKKVLTAKLVEQFPSATWTEFAESLKAMVQVGAVAEATNAQGEAVHAAANEEGGSGGGGEGEVEEEAAEASEAARRRCRRR